MVENENGFDSRYDTPIDTQAMLNDNFETEIHSDEDLAKVLLLVQRETMVFLSSKICEIWQIW